MKTCVRELMTLHPMNCYAVFFLKSTAQMAHVAQIIATNYVRDNNKYFMHTEQLIQGHPLHKRGLLDVSNTQPYDPADKDKLSEKTLICTELE